MPRPNKKHHKIPATYLEGFVDGGSKLWVANKKYKVFSQTPNNLLTENDYYTIRFPNGGGTLVVETKYLGGIEGNYADLYRRKISGYKNISIEEKAFLAIFVASMMERQPQSRRSLERFFNDVKEKIEHFGMVPPENLKKFAQILPPSGVSIPTDGLLEAAKDVGSLHTSLIPKVVEEIAPVLFQMHWVFAVRENTSKPFLTSDNPFTMVNAIAENRYGKGVFASLPGLEQEDIDVTLPLSSDIALVLGWKFKGDCVYLSVSSDYVDEINRRTSRSAEIIIGRDRKMLEEIIERVRLLHSGKEKMSS